MSGSLLFHLFDDPNWCNTSSKQRFKSYGECLRERTFIKSTFMFTDFDVLENQGLARMGIVRAHGFFFWQWHLTEKGRVMAMLAM